MENLIEIESVEQFEEINKEGKVLIDFWASWCAPCRMMLPVIDQLSQENESVTFLKVNVEKVPELASRYGVRSIPQFSFLNEGEEVQKKLGTNSVSQMQEILDSIDND